MSYRERRVVVSLISTILIATIYFAYVFQNYPKGSAYSVEAFHFWGASVFIIVPISIVVRIVTEIVISIANSIATREKPTYQSDERDKLIELRGLRYALFVFVFGFMLALGSLVIDQPPTVMFLVTFVSGFVSGMIGDITQLYYYRKGF